MTEVVIAGAGPNGLMLACELALAGIVPVVLDPLAGPSDEPKANGLVGQVVRQLDMRGLYREFSGDPHPPRPTDGWIFSGMALDFSGLDANPMHAWMLSQPQLVRRLENRARGLGVDIRWGHELTGFTPGSDRVTVAVASPTGRYGLDCAWLVGADGGRSMVRKALGIAFNGSTSPTVARVAHVRLPEGMLAADGSLDIPGFGPIPFGHNRFDTGCMIFAPLEHDRPLLGTLEYGWTPDSTPEPMSLDDLRASLRRILGVDVEVAEPSGPGPHALRRIEGQNTRQADRYRKGRVLLAGDAAHVHSAMGGPGLNLGLQDVVNLGWKLAAVVNGWAPQELLDTYESERHPVGQRVMMHSQAQIALMAPGPEIGALRGLFGELLTSAEVGGRMARLLAGADVRYDMGPAADDHALSGFMVPDIAVADGRRAADLLHDAGGLLLDGSGGAAAVTAAPWMSRIRCVEAGMDGGPAAMLIRPDGYVAWAADDFGSAPAAGLTEALGRWFGDPLRPAWP
ncbi:FAD-dependent monooxygenase [Mycobacterium sp. WMMD1722]|uniref:FAD-dependent monooxygenase n=1 Tax=Mycobacterium sp. WMMD1722 TaxID=3404117 RepID=UPI003BF5D3C3